MNVYRILLLIPYWVVPENVYSQSKKEFSIIAYFMGGPEKVDSITAAGKLTHMIYSFAYLDGNRITLRLKSDSAAVEKLVALKKKNPHLKILIAFGGWGGCETCSDIFSTQENRFAFAQSVKEMTDHFGTDGIDLDWEFPALPTLKGHGYKPEDKQNFTSLVREVRGALGANKEVSFAAGGFKWTLNTSIEWAAVMPMVDRVHLMSYDFLVRNKTGHHSSLYSTVEQSSSADYFIRYLVELGVPINKIVIGAAFYAKVWDSIPPVNNGLYQTGKPGEAIPFKFIEDKLRQQAGYIRYWDSTAQAPYIYNEKLQRFITYDNENSVKAKTGYALKNGLNGIMFWQLSQDKYVGGLAEAIYKEASLTPGKMR